MNPIFSKKRVFGVLLGVSLLISLFALLFNAGEGFATAQEGETLAPASGQEKEIKKEGEEEFDSWMSAHPKSRGFETFGDFYNILQYLEKTRIGEGESERIQAAAQILLADAIRNLAVSMHKEHGSKVEK